MATHGSKAAAMLLGKAITLSRIGVKQIPCVQVRCSENEFNAYLKMYFAFSSDYWALDKNGNVKLGDMVLIQPMDSSERASSTVTHKINRVIDEFGSHHDPITKKRMLHEGRYSDEVELRKRLIEETVEDGTEEELDPI